MLPLDGLFVVLDDPTETWRRCGGYYSCPKNSTGQREGPLVGHTGKYDAGGGEMKQYVGDEYWNFARVEQYSEVLDDFAEAFAENIGGNLNWEPTLALGAPMGGILLAGALGRKLGIRTIFAEKKVTVAATPKGREESTLVVKRHEIRPRDLILVVEDVCHNFSTTDELVKLSMCGGGMVLGIACAMNRSAPLYYRSISVLARIHRPAGQWQQDDPDVADDIARGNVIWEPKAHWEELTAALEQNTK